MAEAFLRDKYFGGWDSRENVLRSFFPAPYDWDDEPVKYPAPDDFPTDEEILFAWYDYEDYSGKALVVYERDGKLYEVNGSHCSCYALEGQWEPEETDAQSLGMRCVRDEEYSGYGPSMDDAAVACYRELFPEFTPLDHEPRQ